MAKLIATNPPLPKLLGKRSVEAVITFLDAFLKAVYNALRELALRANVSVTTDGVTSMEAPLPLAAYTVAGLPTAADWTGAVIYVSDGTSNKRLAISDGTNWRFPDGNVVS